MAPLDLLNASQIINIIMAPLDLFTASQTFYNFVLLK